MLRILLLPLFLPVFVLAQQEHPRSLQTTVPADAGSVTLQISLAHSTATSCDVYLTDRGFSGDFLKMADRSIPLDSLRNGYLSFQLDKPVFARFYYTASDSDRSSRVYTLFLTPGDHLSIQADPSQDKAVTVTGRGAENNQPLIGTFPAFPELYLYTGDTLPDRAEQAVDRLKKTGDSALRAYIPQYHPSAAFVRGWTEEMAYVALYNYYAFKENNKFGIQDAYARQEKAWQRVQDSLFANVKLDNSAALSAPSYLGLLFDFLLRTKEALWRDAEKNPAAFYRQWYDTTESAGFALFHYDQQNLLVEKIIDHYFYDPAVVAYLYGFLVEGALATSNPTNLVPIYDHLKERYPHSPYVNWFRGAVAEVEERERLGLGPGIRFAPDSGARLQTLDDVLALVKGKTVLVDMWGTWCSPCRQEIEKNSVALHTRFRDQPLEFLYIANYDEKATAKWKELIAYFQLQGLHVLASQALTSDILKKVKGTGFPTYVIIHKDGTYELSQAGYPMNRDALIAQIEKAL